METIKLKKEKIKNLIISLVAIERKYEIYFSTTSIFNFLDVKIKGTGFSVEFDSTMPEPVLEEVVKIFNFYKLDQKK
jgi:hypothetical protein